MPASNFGTRLAGGLQDIIPLLMSLQQRQDMLGQRSIENKRAKTQEERAKEIFQLEKDVAQTNRLQQMFENLKTPPPKAPTGKMGELKYLIEGLGLPQSEALNRIYPPRPERIGTTAKQPKAEPTIKKSPEMPASVINQLLRGVQQSSNPMAGFAGQYNNLMGILNPGNPMSNIRQDLQQGFRSPTQTAPAQNQVIPGLTPEETAEYYQLMKEIGGGR